MNDHRDPSTWSFRRGAWFGIFGEHATVVLPPTEKARVAAVWELVDEGAGFDETRDALISSGLRDLPGFVLVSESDGETRIVLRGAARAHFATADGVVHVEGDGATTWVERTLSDVTRIRIEVAEEASYDDLVVSGGLVRLGTAEWPPVSPEAESAQSDPSPPPPPPPPPSAPPTAPPAAPPPPPPPLAEPPDSDHDGLTQTGTLGEAPGEPSAPPVSTGPVARLVFSSGETVDVDRVVLVGRAPEAGRTGAADQPRLVSVPSPQQEISSTHLEVRPGSGADQGSAVVTDLGSTNGTLLVRPGRPPEDLRPGVAVQLVPGAVIDLGDGVTARVDNP